MIKEAIDQQLSALIGIPLCQAGRMLDMATFGFGRLIEQPGRGGRRQVPEYRLHVQGTWRVTNAGVVLLGYADWHYPPRGSTVDYHEFVEQDEGRDRQDDLRDDWLAHGAEAHTVVHSVGTQAGDLAIAFVDGCAIETFVNQATPGENGDDEFWRLLLPSATGDGPHFVVTARGINPQI